ncbi:MAG TPA: GNAT family N-acetyltransferase [Bryobacteraceae bacterium]|jgi:ribosomal protein S18 acetylase RimI-like enzyme|nr:GNAT family N-acetyltransferase [Bryobacteraceae bacterium]
MAALPEYADSRIIDLRKIAAVDLLPVLEEEAAAWKSGLDWDLRPATELVQRFVQMQALNGYALDYGGNIVGYSYYVCEEGKGLIGDLYVLGQARTPEHENLLIEAVLDSLFRVPGIRRVEAQLLMLGPPVPRPMPYPSWFHAYPRKFLEIPAVSVFRLSGRPTDRIAITTWTENRQDDSARLVAAAYRGHIDSEINDQYRAPAGARRFLANIVQYPGCGSFFAPASYAATDTQSGALCGISLASLVASDVGHITQVCVAPSHRGMGLGYELLRRSLLALAAHGCRSVSLTVTASNDTALRLYQRMGFTQRREFAASVWNSR